MIGIYSLDHLANAIEQAVGETLEEAFWNVDYRELAQQIVNSCREQARAELRK